MRAFIILAMVTPFILAGSSAYSASYHQVVCDLKAKDALLAGPGCARAWFDENIRINEVQSVGTSESYKLEPSAPMLSLIRLGSSADAQALDYSEPTISEQLDTGARSLAFDVAYNPKGGLYKYPAGALMAGELVSDYYIKAISVPGFKVLHILDIDFNSSCVTLVACLNSVAKWSRAHRDHLPIMVAIRTNDDRTPMPGATRPLKFDGTAFDSLDAEIRSVFNSGEIITPDMVQGSFPTLHDAVFAHNWPKIGASRGKVIFVLDDDPQKVAIYRGTRRSLEGRAMFVNANQKSPVAAFVTVENPVQAGSAIAALVKAGLIVHTFADANTKEARTGNTLRRDKAFASGAQVISTDFLIADKTIGKYEVHVPNHRVAQCDVQLMPQRCAGWDVEVGNGKPSVATQQVVSAGNRTTLMVGKQGKP